MLDYEEEDQLVKKVGGKLRLTSLMQKRLVELKRVDLLPGRGVFHISRLVNRVVGRLASTKDAEAENKAQDQYDKVVAHGVTRYL